MEHKCSVTYVVHFTTMCIERMVMQMMMMMTRVSSRRESPPTKGVFLPLHLSAAPLHPFQNTQHGVIMIITINRNFRMRIIALFFLLMFRQSTNMLGLSVNLQKSNEAPQGARETTN